MVTIIMDLMHQGGWIMWPILCASFIIWWSGLWRLYTIYETDLLRKRFAALWEATTYKGKSRTNGTAPTSCGNPVGDRLLATRHTQIVTDAFFRSEYTALFLPSLTSIWNGLTTMGVLITVAPLLGLLGTVAGMMETFRIITVYGVGNPALTAEGISIALLTTEAGLTAAFPGLLLHVFVSNRRNNLQRRLSGDGERLCRSLVPELHTIGGQNV